MPVYRLSKAHVKARGDISTIALRYSYAFPTIFLSYDIEVLTYFSRKKAHSHTLRIV